MDSFEKLKETKLTLKEKIYLYTCSKSLGSV